MTADRVHELVQRTNRLLVAARLAARALGGSVYALAIVLGMIFVDAMFGLPPLGLIVIDALLLAVAVAIVGTLVLVLIQGRLHARRVALHIEQRLSVPGSALVNALDLRNAAPGGTTSAALTQLAVQRGNDAAAALDAGRVVDWKHLRRAGLRALAALAVALTAYLAMPGVFAAVTPRLANPLGDHPPFTTLRFDVRVDPDPVYHGKPAAIQAALSGPSLPGSAEVVFIEADGSRLRVPMLQSFAASDADAPIEYYVFRIDEARWSREFYIDTTRGRSKRYTLAVLPVPRFERVQVDYAFPNYTGWEPTTKPVTPAGLRALAGSQATLRITSNVPLQGGTITLTPTGDSDTQPSPAQVSLSPLADDPRVVTGTFTVDGNADLSIELEGADGTLSAAAFETSIEAITDGKPRVSIAEPPARLIVPENWVVAVEVRASDDIGVDRVYLTRGVNGWAPTKTELPLTFEGSGQTRARADTTFDLPALGAKAGDVITYRATAYDRHPDGTGVGESEAHAIQVITEEEYLEYERTRYRIDDMHEEFAEFERRLDDLEAQRAAILERLEAIEQKLADGEALSADEQAELEALREQLDQYMDNTMSLFEDLRHRTEAPTLYEFENQYKDLLDRMATELQPQVGAASKLASRAEQVKEQDTPDARQRLAEAAEDFRQTQDPFTEPFEEERQEAEQNLEALQQADDLMAAGERLRAVIGEQQELAQRLSEFRDKPNLTPEQQRQAQQLAQEQSELEQELAEATQQLRDAAEAGAENLPRMAGGAREMAERIDQMQIMQDMAQASGHAEQGADRAAHESAQQAADKLDKLLSDANGLPNEGSQDLDGCFNLPREQMREAMQQMAQSRGIPGRGQQGGDGSGFSGSQARMAVQGPAMRGNQRGGAEGQRSGGHGDGQGRDHGVETLDPSESLDPQQAATRAGGGAAMPGVPLEYRDEAQAYFRRLAEDAENQPE